MKVHKDTNNYPSTRDYPNHKVGRIPRELMVWINKMANWQRNQWARAGYPNDLEQVKRFARLQRDGTELYVGSVV